MSVQRSEKNSPPLDPDEELLCFCNRVQTKAVKAAIAQGANTLPKIYDACGAGNGACGGSCRENLKALLHEQSLKAKKEIDTSVAPLPRALVEAVSLFNRRYFWECHEVLEDEWMEETGPRKKFYQGLIQAAAAMYHVLNANPTGCLRLAAEARAKLEPYAPTYLQMPLKGLLQRLEEFEISSKEILGSTKSGFDYDRIPKLVLGKSMSETDETADHK